MWSIPSHCVNIYCYDWFNIKTDWPIDRQHKFRGRAKERMLGRKKVESGVTGRPREARWYQAIRQRIDMRYGLL